MVEHVSRTPALDNILITSKEINPSETNALRKVEFKLNGK